MLPPIVNDDLHLIDETEPTGFFPVLSFLLPLPNTPGNRGLLQPRRGEPSRNSIFPQPEVYLRKGEPTPRGMYLFVGRSVVSYANVGVEENTSGTGCRVVCVDKTAFGALEV
jgi:hypothetical protein